MSDSDQPGNSSTARSVGLAVDRRLLELLVCPVTHQALDYRSDRQELVSRSAKLAFPIRDGIPIMLAEVARELTDDES